MSIPVEQWIALERRRRIAAVAVVLVIVGWGVVRVIDQWSNRIVADRRPRGTVVEVIGPTTVVAVTDGRRVNAELAGVAVPVGWEPRARQWLVTHSQGQPITLVRPRAGTVIQTDIGWLIYTEAGGFVNEMMIDQGFAIADGTQHDLSTWFSQLSEWAQRKQRGLWADTKEQ